MHYTPHLVKYIFGCVFVQPSFTIFLHKFNGWTTLQQNGETAYRLAEAVAENPYRQGLG